MPAEFDVAFPQKAFMPSRECIVREQWDEPSTDRGASLYSRQRSRLRSIYIDEDSFPFESSSLVRILEYL